MARKNVIQFSVEVVDKISARLDGIGRNVARFTRRAAVAAAGLATAFGLAARQAISMGDELGKTAKVVGVSAETLQELRFAAQQAGVESRGLDDSLRRMQRRMGEFINSGAGPAQKALESLNIEIVDASGNFIGTEAAFRRVVTAMGTLNSTAERSAVAAQLFGDDFGPKLVALTDQGVDGIAALREEARRLGLVIDNESIAAAEDANDAFGRLESAIRTKYIKAFADNAEAIEAIATAFLNVTIAAVEALSAFGKWVGFIKESATEEYDRLTERVAEYSAELNKMVQQTSYAEASQTRYFQRVTVKMEEAIARMAELAPVVFGELKKIEEAAADTGEALTGVIVPKRARRGEAGARIHERLTREAKWEQQRANVEKYINSLDEVIEQQEEAAESARELGRDIGLTFTSAFEEAIISGNKFRDVLQGIYQDLLRLAVRKLLTEPILAFFSGFFTRAGGGPVNAGQPYIVGERGPELFIPNASGNIASNAALSGGANGMQFVTKIDARGADPGLIARLPQIMEQRDRRLMIKVKQYIETGGVSL